MSTFDSVIKRYEFAGAENVAAQIAQMLNENNRDKTKSYFVRKDVYGCSLIEARDISNEKITVGDEQQEAKTDDETK